MTMTLAEIRHPVVGFGAEGPRIFLLSSGTREPRAPESTDADLQTAETAERRRNPQITEAIPGEIE
jgi:hypothetical protein